MGTKLEQYLEQCLGLNAHPRRLFDVTAEEMFELLNSAFDEQRSIDFRLVDAIAQEDDYAENRLDNLELFKCVFYHAKTRRYFCTREVVRWNENDEMETIKVLPAQLLQARRGRPPYQRKGSHSLLGDKRRLVFDFMGHGKYIWTPDGQWPEDWLCHVWQERTSEVNDDVAATAT